MSIVQKANVFLLEKKKEAPLWWPESIDESYYPEIIEKVLVAASDEDLKVPLDSEDIFSIFYYDVLCYHVCEDHFSHIDVDTIMEPENQWIYDQFLSAAIDDSIIDYQECRHDCQNCRHCYFSHVSEGYHPGGSPSDCYKCDLLDEAMCKYPGTIETLAHMSAEDIVDDDLGYGYDINLVCAAIAKDCDLCIKIDNEYVNSPQVKLTRFTNKVQDFERIDEHLLVQLVRADDSYLHPRWFARDVRAPWTRYLVGFGPAADELVEV